MPISPELRARVIELSKTMGRNAIARALCGQLSRPSITKILRENHSSGHSEANGNLPQPEDDKLPSNENLPAQAEDTGNKQGLSIVKDSAQADAGNTSMDKTGVVTDGPVIPGSTTSEEDVGDDDYQNLPFPDAMKSDSKYEVDSIQHQILPLLPSIPSLTASVAVRVQAQKADTPAIAVQPVTPTTTVKLPITEPEEDIEWDFPGCGLILELKQKKREVEERERRVAEVENLLPLARDLKELGWENHAVCWIQTIHEVSEVDDIDLNDATQKVMEIVLQISTARRLASSSHAYR